MRHAIASR